MRSILLEGEVQSWKAKHEKGAKEQAAREAALQRDLKAARERQEAASAELVYVNSKPLEVRFRELCDDTRRENFRLRDEQRQMDLVLDAVREYFRSQPL